jgi:hypothetical protein
VAAGFWLLPRLIDHYRARAPQSGSE